MAEILETSCTATLRKDCSSRMNCQLRHSGEEIGKDILYYVRKFERSSVDSQSESVEDSKTSFPIASFNKVKVKGDGHCIIHSVLHLLQLKGGVEISKEELLDRVKVAFQADLE